ncbi:uncharacterized protein AB675_2578 [Cyphellophora attinorum]|uniref:Uncharacterized protein n=1 Tax=Cyphellophora attinorum TaxID=1664694 RepID=A0A0N0NRF2_9EURO|nr:uncharacterized protein AB675_2578 [Phialophora attinorum]KPI45021.1 hypothetical protein AB675_2578 [Phialophora attinorum]
MLSLFGHSTGRRASNQPEQTPTVTSAQSSRIPRLASIRIRIRSRSAAPLRQSDNMPIFPSLRLDTNRAHFRSLRPGWTYVDRLGRGSNRRNYFIRAAPGRTTPYTPPPWPVPDEDYFYCDTESDHDDWSDDDWPGPYPGGEEQEETKDRSEILLQGRESLFLRYRYPMAVMTGTAQGGASIGRMSGLREG